MTGIKIVKDEIVERLDELADLGLIWNKNRDAGGMPRAVQSAMISVARELTFLVEVQEKSAIDRDQNE